MNCSLGQITFNSISWRSTLNSMNIGRWSDPEAIDNMPPSFMNGKTRIVQIAKSTSERPSWDKKVNSPKGSDCVRPFKTTRPSSFSVFRSAFPLAVNVLSLVHRMFVRALVDRSSGIGFSQLPILLFRSPIIIMCPF